ncbi:Ca2+-binding protein [Ordospora colligata]|uniref:Ca2+-binding protein n=1 Tax=Ordospora colligata OC4 TaxID=1354746 RepID=A0A0B2UKN4_9MICR|nr:Ca2+-binding protein [Ordospora colligata OC4]KHN69928.1 Ca2+-binding protein [Ordospora colligata OC4]TBU16098.1 Ca2+-binding protein [Ordospora colligata]TBU16311.1 Ca2+-binding protein [Ordospora colligata]TBU19015.1 Ca2+-binding protein [Ordospora colligata]
MGSSVSTMSEDMDSDLRQFSHFPTNDLHQWLVAFKKAYPTGYITAKNLEDMFRGYFPFGSPEAFSKRLFETINISESCAIDFHELMIAYSILVKGSDHERLRWIFRFYDTDGDGVVSRQEMLCVIQSIIEMTSKTLELGLDPSSVTENIFNSIDYSKNTLNFEDFKTLLVQNKKAFDMLIPFS